MSTQRTCLAQAQCPIFRMRLSSAAYRVRALSHTQLHETACSYFKFHWRACQSSAPLSDDGPLDLTPSTKSSHRITKPVSMTKDELLMTQKVDSGVTTNQRWGNSERIERHSDRGESAERWLPKTGAKPGKQPKYRKKTVQMPNVAVQGEILYGKFPVLIALKANKRRVHKLYVKESMFHNDGSSGILGNLVAFGKQQGIKVEAVSQHFLSGLILDPVQGLRQHQGICADVSKKKYIDVMELVDRSCLDQDHEDPGYKPQLWLVVQSVQDPNNFGAILRTAHYLGVGQVVAHNSCKLSPAVSKVSAGALELMDVYCVDDLVDFLEECKKKNWQVLGTAGMRKTSGTVVNLNSVNVERNTVVVLGNEGLGLTEGVTALCDQLIMVGRTEAQTGQTNLLLDSLNVSVATGIILHDLTSKRNKPS